MKTIKPLKSPRPSFIPKPGPKVKKKLKCIPIEIYNKIKEEHPEYFL